MPEQNGKLAERLKVARERAGLSQGQAALLLKVRRPAISEVEAGKRRVKAEELSEMAELYGVTTTWLLGDYVERDPRIELAAREIAKLKPDDLDRLLNLLTSLRKEEGD